MFPVVHPFLSLWFALKSCASPRLPFPSTPTVPQASVLTSALAYRSLPVCRIFTFIVGPILGVSFLLCLSSWCLCVSIALECLPLPLSNPADLLLGGVGALLEFGLFFYYRSCEGCRILSPSTAKRMGHMWYYFLSLLVLWYFFWGWTERFWNWSAFIILTQKFLCTFKHSDVNIFSSLKSSW